MYEQYFRFKEKPFNLTPDPKFFFRSKQHQGALDHLLYGIQQREGFLAVVGDVGTGKTTLCRCLLDKMDKDLKVALVLNPMVSDMDLLRTCVQDLGVRPLIAPVEIYSSGPPAEAEEAEAKDEVEAEDEDAMEIDPDSLAIPIEESDEDPLEPDPPSDLPIEGLPAVEMGEDWFYGASKMELIDALNAFLLEQYEAGGSTVLIIDEAQNLTLDVMEQLRVLSNLETEKEKLLQIVFVGQRELNDKLLQPELKQLNQRISIRYEIGPLSKEETAQYIQHRLLIAGAGSRVNFKKGALAEVFRYSKGVPRLINLTCDRALLGGYNVQSETIEKAHVRQAIQSLSGKEDTLGWRDRVLPFKWPALTTAVAFLFCLGYYLMPPVKIDFEKQALRVKSLVNKLPFLEAKNDTSGSSSSTATSPAPKGDRVSGPAPAAGPMNGGAIFAAVDSSADTREPRVTRASAPEPGRVDVAGGNYRIQLYSLKEAALAEEEVFRLQEEGYDAFWKKAASPGQDWFIVYVGPFKDSRPARIYVDALKYSGRNPILLSVSTSG